MKYGVSQSFALNAFIMQDEKEEVRSQLVQNMWETLSGAEKEKFDKVIVLLTGHTMSNLISAGDNTNNLIEDHERSRFRGLNQNQIAELMTTFQAIDIFTIEMKDRFLKKLKEGRGGYQQTEELPVSIATELSNRIERVENDETDIGVGIANWGFIHWFRQNMMDFPWTKNVNNKPTK